MAKTEIKPGTKLSMNLDNLEVCTGTELLMLLMPDMYKIMCNIWFK